MILPRFSFVDDFKPYEDLMLKHGGIRASIRKNTVIKDANSLAHVSYYIKSGFAKLVMTNEKGIEHIVFFVGEGSMYPITRFNALLTMEPYLDLIAVTDLEVIAFQGERILDMLQESREMTGAVIDHWVRYTNLLMTKLLLNSYSNSIMCVSSFLYLYALQRHDLNQVISLTQEQVGQMVGLSRVQISRVLTTLRNEGLIQTSNNQIKILDMDRLQERCSDITQDL